VFNKKREKAPPTIIENGKGGLRILVKDDIQLIEIDGRLRNFS
jgi:hypothetical protein